MARTRGASQRVIHADDGELLDADDKPVSHSAIMPQVDFISRPPAPPEPATDSGPARYRIDAATVQRDMDAYELMQVLPLLLGGEAFAELGAEEFAALKADVRRHFRRVA